MAVTISNVGARSIFRQNGVINYGDWRTGNQIQVGYYSESLSYVIQLRFRLDKPCSSIELQAMEASGSGYVYWKVSDKEQDDELITRMVTAGNEADATRAGTWEKFTIEGDFPADTDLYIYGYAYSEWNNVVTLFGLYDSSKYTKVIGATELESYTVTYDANGVGSAPPAETVYKGSSTELPELTADGYAFLGWATTSDAESGITGAYMPTESLTLYAVWGYTITYDANGVGNAPEAETVRAGSSVILPEMSDNEYNFLGWATSSEATEGITGAYTPTQSVTLFAVWQIKFYDISYIYEDEKIVDEKTYGVAITLREATFTREGYVQTGWSTTEGGGIDYELCAVYTTDAALNLYPVWELAIYNITYKYGEEEIVEKKTHGTDALLRGTSFFRNAFTQIGWSTTDGGAVTHALGESYEINAPITLYPVWGIAPSFVLWLLIARMSRGQLKSSGESNTSAALGEAILGAMVLGQE